MYYGEIEDVYEDYSEEDVIENMDANMYLFDEDGELLPTLYHYKDNVHVKTTFGKHQYEVEFI